MPPPAPQQGAGGGYYHLSDSQMRLIASGRSFRHQSVAGRNIVLWALHTPFLKASR
jgi:hypothetical protein